MIRTKKQELAYINGLIERTRKSYYIMVAQNNGDEEATLNDIEGALTYNTLHRLERIWKTLLYGDEYLVVIDGEEFGVYTSFSKARQAIIENFDGDSIFRYADVCIYKL